MKVVNQAGFDISILVYDRDNKRIITQSYCGIGQQEIIGISDGHLLNPDTFDDLIITAHEDLSQDKSYQVLKKRPAEVPGICKNHIIFLMYYCRGEISSYL